MKRIELGAVLLIAGAGMVRPALASISGCPTSSAGSSLSSFGSQGANDGCFQIDKNFDNFSVVTTGHNSDTGNASTSNVDIFGTGGSISGSGAGSTITPILANFDSTQFIATSGTDTLNTVLDFQAAVNGNSAPTPAQWAITGLTLSLGSFTSANPGNTGNSITVVEDFCVGAATFNCTSSSTNFGFIEEQVVLHTSGAPTITDTHCYNDGATSCTSASGLSVTGFVTSTVGISDSITIDRVSGASTDIFLDGFSNAFAQTAETPEPSTFALLGGALVGLGFIRGRRKKV
jgi:PEP-CTERM motif